MLQAVSSTDTRPVESLSESDEKASKETCETVESPCKPAHLRTCKASYTSVEWRSLPNLCGMVCAAGARGRTSRPM
eukprot:6197868-Pleurochrysis_carterae.AAC.2